MLLARWLRRAGSPPRQDLLALLAASLSSASASSSRLIRRLRHCCLPLLSFVVDCWRCRGQRWVPEEEAYN